MADHLFTGGVPVSRVRPVDVTSDAEYSAWFAAYDAGLAHDFPVVPRKLEHEARVSYEPSAVYDTALLAAEDDAGEIVGAAVLELPLKDNLATAQIEVVVPPHARRRGVGTAVLEAVEREAARRGRTRLMVDIKGTSDEPESPGTHFAERHGYTRRIVEILRAQWPPFDMARLAALEKEARPHAVDYETMTWRDRVPDEYVAEFARMIARMSTDAPLGELDYNAEVWDADRVRVREERVARMRRGLWIAAAVGPDGTIAGLTELQLPHDDDRAARQEETIVDPRHRGNRLGILMKIANLRQLLHDRPDVQSVWTGNADTNTFMISVNEQLGYEVSGWVAGFQRDR